MRKPEEAAFFVYSRSFWQFCQFALRSCWSSFILGKLSAATFVQEIQFAYRNSSLVHQSWHSSAALFKFPVHLASGVFAAGG